MIYRTRQQKDSSRGFTLIELLVVIAILGIISAIIMVSLSNARAKSRDARRKSDAHQIQNALELYYSKCGTYAVMLNCSGPVYGDTGYGYTNGFNLYWPPVSSASMAQGLVDNGAMTAIVEDPNGNVTPSRYVIYVPLVGSGAGKSYSLIMKLERPTQNDLNTITTANCPIPNTWPGTWMMDGRNYCVTN